MDTKVKGIILKLTDYKEADKIASIFTFEEGIISAKFTGVKKDKAKFKAVAQSFCFADFVINKKQNFNTITSANLIDNFFGLTTNYNKTMCGYIVLDALQTLLVKENAEHEIFLQTLSSLKDIEQNEEHIALINFILKFIYFSGLGVEFDAKQNVWLDKFTGNFTSAKTEYSIGIDKKVYNIILAINNGEKPQAILQTLKQAVKLMHTILLAKFGLEIKSFKYL